LVEVFTVFLMRGNAPAGELKRGGTITVRIDEGPVNWDPHISLAFFKETALSDLQIV